MDFKGRARMIFALLGGIVFLVLQAIFPNALPFSETQVVLFVGLIGAYILGEGVSGKRIEDNLSALIHSQKFQALLIGLIVTSIKAFFPQIPFSDSELMAIAGSFAAFILGAGVTNKAPVIGG